MTPFYDLTKPRENEYIHPPPLTEAERKKLYFLKKNELIDLIEFAVHDRVRLLARRRQAEARTQWLEQVHTQGPLWSAVEAIERVCASIATAAREKRHTHLTASRRDGLS